MSDEPHAIEDFVQSRHTDDSKTAGASLSDCQQNSSPEYYSSLCHALVEAKKKHPHAKSYHIFGDGTTHPSQSDPDHPQVHSARFFSSLKTAARKTIGTLHVGEKQFSMMVKGRITHYICAADGDFVEVEDEGEGAGEVEAAQDPSTEA